MHRLAATLIALLAVLAAPVQAQQRSWAEIEAAARGQAVYWRAWAGDGKVNAFITWAAAILRERNGIELHHVKDDDPGNAVTAVLAEKAAGVASGGKQDLLWLNGENFAAMKENGLLHGPFTHLLPNFALVDTEGKPTTLVDFTVPTDGYESPWGMAQLTFYYDSETVERPPRSIPAILEWAAENPGRFTYPAPPDFTGSTFLKQALLELAPDRSVFAEPVTDAGFETASAPLWAYLDRLHPHLWRGGRAFPPNYPRMRQLVDDGEVDIAFAFNPAEAASAASLGLLPESVRAYVLEGGTIANTHFVAIPFNSSAKEGALVVANFLLSPEAQARKADPALWGDPTVLDMDKLSPDQRALFDRLERPPAMPPEGDLSRTLPEPHPSWMVRIEEEWKRRYAD
ncbi:ABC transporter substrate-binding protein [Indioceanicola profundi]|uniref:ABC transporter substrate-binding protein n=1 Tax=Indioceanicola profundi TaxID=2220096 RepID=UPI000E6A9667|nr:ABC transporter substrate-binding protein [Indioceanicola profundi]